MSIRDEVLSGIKVAKELAWRAARNWSKASREAIRAAKGANHG